MLFKAPGLREGLKLNNRIGCFFALCINCKHFLHVHKHQVLLLQYDGILVVRL